MVSVLGCLDDFVDDSEISVSSPDHHFATLFVQEEPFFGAHPCQSDESRLHAGDQILEHWIGSDVAKALVDFDHVGADSHSMQNVVDEVAGPRLRGGDDVIEAPDILEEVADASQDADDSAPQSGRLTLLFLVLVMPPDVHLDSLHQNTSFRLFGLSAD